MKYAIGDVDGVPSFANTGHEHELLDGEASWKIGETVIVLGKEYVVRALEDVI